MSGLLDSTLGVVGQVGDAVDKVTGGRALRGALAGKPRELASFVPFSDTLGLTDKKDATSGRDLTDAYGLTRKGDDSFGSHAAGFLADTVLSPGNLIGGYGAFKAAPTLAKGVVAGGKALTGLDVLDHLGHGAKALGNMAFKNVDDLHGGTISALRGASDDTIRSAAGFGGGEAGSLKYHVPHKPVDIDALRSETLPANASRPRRWSTNPAERSYYSSDRSRRYAERMSGREIPRGAGPEGIPEFNLDDAFRGFASGESGAARIKKGDTYGLADPSQARRAMEAEQPVSHGPFVEPTTDSGYRMKPGPIPRSKRPAPAAVPSAPLPPKHGPDSDLLAAYENMTKGFRRDVPMETYVIPDEVRAEASAHSGEFAREASDTLNQYNSARELTPSLLDRITSRFKNPADLWKHFAGGFVANEGGFLKVPIPGVDPATANAMDGLGPMYPGGPGKLKTLADSVLDNEGARSRLSAMYQGPDGAGIANEIPEGSTFLGSGASSIALRTPEGGVVRIADKHIAGRPDLAEMLQPVREARSGNYTIEHLPYVEKLAGQEAGAAARALKGRLHASGHNPWDVTDNNVGRTAEGKGIVFDGDAVFPGNSGSGSFGQRPVYDPPTGVDLADAVAAGGPNLVREAIRKGILMGTKGQGIPVPAVRPNPVSPVRELFGRRSAGFARQYAGA